MYNLSLLTQHLENHWGQSAGLKELISDPHGKMPAAFSILEFSPTPKHNFWIYSTLGMSIKDNEPLIELHIFSSKRDVGLVELLTATASFHINSTPLGLHHTVNFGQPWQDNSHCRFGFISLPYLDGAELEIFRFADKHLHNLWLLPITESEREYKIREGWDALEELFEACQFDYRDPNRASCA